MRKTFKIWFVPAYHTGNREMSTLVQLLSRLNIKVQWKEPITEADLFKWFFDHKRKSPTKIHQEKINNLYKSSWNTSYVEWSCWRTHFVRTTSWQKRRWILRNFLTKLINEKPRDAQKVLYNLRYIFFYDHCHKLFYSPHGAYFYQLFWKQKGFRK